MSDPEPNTPSRVPDVAVSLIRTWVPVVVGAGITALAAWRGWVIDAQTSALVAVTATAAVTAIYYGLARLLEAARPAFIRTAGRFMLGGVFTKPAYLTDLEYAQLTDLIRRQPGAR